jgi:hypothetical protein
MSKMRWTSSVCKDDVVVSEDGGAGTVIVITRRVDDRVMISLAEVERKERENMPSSRAGISVVELAEECVRFRSLWINADQQHWGWVMAFIRIGSRLVVACLILFLFCMGGWLKRSNV